MGQCRLDSTTQNHWKPLQSQLAERFRGTSSIMTACCRNCFSSACVGVDQVRTFLFKRMRRRGPSPYDATHLFQTQLGSHVATSVGFHDTKPMETPSIAIGRTVSRHVVDYDSVLPQLFFKRMRRRGPSPYDATHLFQTQCCLLGCRDASCGKPCSRSNRSHQCPRQSQRLHLLVIALVKLRFGLFITCTVVWFAFRSASQPLSSLKPPAFLFLSSFFSLKAARRFYAASFALSLNGLQSSAVKAYWWPLASIPEPFLPAFFPPFPPRLAVGLRSELPAAPIARAGPPDLDSVITLAK
jgi:hypothetical protein